jgi:uncharacterized protein (TIGR02646 family)
MRQYRRPGVTVPTLTSGGPGGGRREENVSDYEERGEAPATFPSHWTKPDVRGALYAMHGRVCAYCGADVCEAGNDVEHFRPKSNVQDSKTHGGYWWLAYEFCNYLLSCVICNQRYKVDRFPLRQGGVRVTYGDRQNLPAEPRVLLDPACDTIEDLVTVDWSKPAGKLEPKAGLTAAEAARVAQVLEFFRVNRRAAQRKKRAAIQRRVINKIAENKADEVRYLAVRYRPHSLVAKVILEAKAPQSLPTPQEELEWLLKDLSSDLILKLEDLEKSANPTQLDENEAKELFWALAVLWKDPPAATPQFVEDFLESRGLKEGVESYLERL